MVVHPGIRLRERFLLPLGISAAALARGLGVNRSTVSRLLGGDGSLTPTLAARLGAYFQVPTRWFVQMQADYDAARLDAGVCQGVTPWTPDPDVLLTPDGVVPLGPPSATDASTDGPTDQVTRLANGAVVLEGPRTP